MAPSKEQKPDGVGVNVQGIKEYVKLPSTSKQLMPNKKRWWVVHHDDDDNNSSRLYTSNTIIVKEKANR